MKKVQNLKKRLKISIPIKGNKLGAYPVAESYQNKGLSEKLTKKLISRISLRGKTEVELVKFYDEKNKLRNEDFNYVFFFLQEKNCNNLAKKLLIPIIRKRFPSNDDEHFRLLCLLIENLTLPNETKIFLFINNFVYSKDGGFSGFVDKQSLKNAINIDKNESLRVLAITLHNVFSNSDFMLESTANLIIAFEYVGLKNKYILSMYKRAFKFIQKRLPDDSDFKWERVESSEVSNMNNDEIAIVMILSKAKNLDAFVQKEIIVAISYLIKYDDTLLIKPFRWYFNQIEHFHQLSVASMLELFLIEVGNHSKFLNSIKDDLKKVSVIENLYIHNTLQDILIGLEHE